MGRFKKTGLFNGTNGSPQLKFENGEYEDKVNKNEALSKSKEDIKFLKKCGVKFNENDVVFVIRNDNNKAIWLEKGNDYAGLNHIIKEHGKEFLANGIQEKEIKTIIYKAITKGEIVGVQGVNRNVYKVNFKGKEYTIAITISDNGFIVGANISKNYKEIRNNEKN